MTLLRNCRSLSLVAALLVTAHVASAQTSQQVYCVHDMPTLRNALTAYTAAKDGDVVVIELQQGTYTVANASGQTFDAAYQNTRTTFLQLKGGYDTSCASQVLNPENTVIDGNNEAASGLAFALNGSLSIEGLTLTRLAGATATRAPLDIQRQPTAAGNTISVRHSIIKNNGPSAGTAVVRLVGGSADVKIVNNLIVGNSGDPIQIDETTGNIHFNNNTVSGNSGAIRVASSDPAANIDVSSNIFWANGAVDLDVTGAASPPTVIFNTIAGIAGSIQSTTTNSIFNPAFVDAAGGNFHLKMPSPASDSGAWSQVVGIPSRDLDGNPRIMDGRLDQGAYESSDESNLTTIVVSDPTDNGDNVSPTPGSLREALKNAAGSDSVKITFNLPNCPADISIAGTQLPDITTNVTVDGYSQAGSKPNTAQGAFNGVICVELIGSGSPWAFHTTSTGRLTVRGIGMAGFNDAAVKLESGAGNIVQGNLIGLPFASHNAIGVSISSDGNGNNASQSLIGAIDDVSAANVITGSSVVGIYMDTPAGGNIIANNLIGVLPDGSTAKGNGRGIYDFNSPNNQIDSNVIGASAAEGVLVLGGTGVEIKNNLIGLTANGGPLVPNGTEGVSLVVGAANNVVGSGLATLWEGNSIISTNDSVLVDSSAGTGNAILANKFMFSNSGDLPVDLGGNYGPDPNDNGDIDAGGNKMQNYPVVLNVYRTMVGDWVEGTLDTAANTTYRLDLYWSPLNLTRANAFKYAGMTTVTTDATGHGHFWKKVPLSGSTTQYAIGGTATSSSADTSEMGEPANESFDMIFRDDVEL